MRTIGGPRIVSPDELPAVMEELRKHPADPAELERRLRLAEEVDRIRDAMQPLKNDVKEIIRNNWERRA